MDRLPKQTRQERILKRLTNDVSVRISTLANEFDVTTETIRRDLDDLSARGLLSRTYGGAAVRSVAGEPGVLARSQEQVAERERIAELAARTVKPGDVLMIDAGSTTAFFAQALARKPFEITAITNSLTVAQALGVAETITVLLCPGEFRFTEEGVFGAEVISFLDRYHADLAVIGAGGVAGDEVTDADLQGAAVKRKMMARAQRTMLLADHGKFGQRHFATVCNAGAIDILVTDQALPQGTAQIWREVRVAGSRDEDVAA